MAREPGRTLIQKVPRFLRRDRSNFEPRMVLLGPIRHRNVMCQMEDGDAYDYKLKLIDDFVQASGKEFDVLRGQIKKIINQLRNCFEKEEVEVYGNNALASLLCDGGCAILQYIYKLYKRPTYNMSDDIAQDILLLENQIPYKVLKELMQLSVKKEELAKSIVNFIEKHANRPSQANPQGDLQIDGDHIHLLDLLRKSLLGKSQAKTPNKRRDLPPLRNVRELKAAGIHLRPSSGWFFSNISFRRRFHLLGRLYLPPIVVDNSTRRMFLNLVAYEMYLDPKNDPGPGVISYLSFLDSLIDEAQDVKELRDAGVLDGFLGSATELQTLFRELRDAGVLPDDHDAYIGVKEEIQNYYGTWMSKMVQFYHAYIKDNSWPLVIVLAVLFDLFFSVTQTWFSVKTWFSVSRA